MANHLQQVQSPARKSSNCIRRMRDLKQQESQQGWNDTLPDIRVAITSGTMSEIRALRKREYKEIYPTMDLDNDALDQQAITLFTRDIGGRVNSTARLGVNGRHELPEHEFLQEYHSSNTRLMEWGRFIICDGSTQLLKSYYETVYTLSTSLGFEAIVMAMRPNHIALHKRLVDAVVVVPDMGVNYGGSCNLACVVWELEATKPEFFNWIWR